MATKKTTIANLSNHQIAQSLVSSGEEYVFSVIDSIEAEFGELEQEDKKQLMHKISRWLELSSNDFQK